MNPQPAPQGHTPTPGNSWYLVKRGLYYRPNGAGYTAQQEDAGVFSEAYAKDHVRSTAGEKDPTMRVKMVRVPTWSGSHSQETDLRIKYDALLSESARQSQRIEQLEGALELASCRLATAGRRLTDYGSDFGFTVADWSNEANALAASTLNQTEQGK